MKHFTNFLMLAAIAVASLASCARELDNPEKDNTAPEGYYMEEIFASYPAAETRTAFDGTTGKFSWSEGDEIAFHLSDGSYTVAEIDPATSKVKLYIREGLTRDNFAVYPASAAIQEHSTIGDMQVKLPNAYNVSDDPTTDYVPMPMVATQDETNHLKFNHTGALLQVNLDIPAGTKTAKVSLGDKALSGTLTVVADGDYYKTNATSVDQVSDGGNTITFTVSEEENGLAENTQAYLRLPVSTGTYDEIKIVYSDGEYDTYEFHKDVTMSFSRSGGKKLSIAESQFEDPRDYFWIEALEAGSTVSFGTLPTQTQWETYGQDERFANLFYSLDKRTWTRLFKDDVITLENVGDRAWFYSDGNNPIGAPNGNNNDYDLRSGKERYKGTGRLKCGGELAYLWKKGTEPLCDKALVGLFFNMTALEDASEVVFPTETTSHCYYGMFHSCTNLVSVPDVLPATELADACYDQMFYRTSSLATVITLPATRLAPSCYEEMFRESGIVEPPILAFEYTDKYCCRWMFRDCDSMVNGPILHNKDVSVSCFSAMFSGCDNLVRGPEMTEVAEMANSCYYYMFQYCKKLTDLPFVLSATTFAKDCFRGIFDTCSSLNKITVGFTEWTDATVNATKGWVVGVAAEGKFYKPQELATEYNNDRIPTGWTVYVATEVTAPLNP